MLSTFFPVVSRVLVEHGLLLLSLVRGLAEQEGEGEEACFWLIGPFSGTGFGSSRFFNAIYSS